MTVSSLSRRTFVVGAAGILAMPWIARSTFATEKRTIQVGHEVAVDHPVHIGWTEASRVAAEKSEGRIDLSIFPSSQFGSGRDMFQQVLDGSLGAMMFGFGGASAFQPSLGIFEAPYLANDWDQLVRMLRSPWAAEQFERLASDQGARVVGTPWYYGTRHFTTNGIGLQAPGDAKGLKLRVPETATAMAMIRSLGASPTPMALSEVYLGLQTNVVDGQENPLPTIASNKFFEVQKFLSLTGHMIPSFPPFFNEELWTALPEVDRAILTDALEAGGKANNEAAMAKEALLVAEMEKNGMTIVKSDRAAFRDVTKSIYPQFDKIWGAGAIEELQAM